MEILPLEAEHWAEVARIYAEGIATGNATFETEVPAWEDWDAGHVPALRLVAVGSDGDEELLGWAALSPVSDRCVYTGVAESSVYIASAARGRGVGTALMEELIRRSELAGLWTLQTGIFPENEASLALHRSVGFRVIGTRERIGQHHGRWRDVVFLERRRPDPAPAASA
ncbi:MAG TPA: GNAT family N-acetyltransferase [Gaiellaceae bacterium]|jgi:phosphinothricin acetyltransferase